MGGGNASDLFSWDGESWATEAFPPPDPASPRKPPQARRRKQPALPAPSAVGRAAQGATSAAAAAGHRKRQHAAARAGNGDCEGHTPTTTPDTAASSPSRSDLLAALSDRAFLFRGGDASLPVQALLTAHYSVHGAFLQPDGVLLARAGELGHIPAIAVQGQEDLVCPPGTAQALHAAWPGMQLRLVPRAAHSMYHPHITHELVLATEALKGVCQLPVKKHHETARATQLVSAATPA